MGNYDRHGNAPPGAVLAVLALIAFIVYLIYLAFATTTMTATATSKKWSRTIEVLTYNSHRYYDRSYVPTGAYNVVTSSEYDSFTEQYETVHSYTLNVWEHSHDFKALGGSESAPYWPKAPHNAPKARMGYALVPDAGWEKLGKTTETYTFTFKSGEDTYKYVSTRPDEWGMVKLNSATYNIKVNGFGRVKEFSLKQDKLE